jgi:hypothetical protein
VFSTALEGKKKGVAGFDLVTTGVGPLLIHQHCSMTCFFDSLLKVRRLNSIIRFHTECKARSSPREDPIYLFLCIEEKRRCVLAKIISKGDYSSSQGPGKPNEVINTAVHITDHTIMRLTFRRPLTSGEPNSIPDQSLDKMWCRMCVR